MKIPTSTKEGKDFERPRVDEGHYSATLKEVKDDIAEGKFGARVAFIYQLKDNNNTELAHVCYKNTATKDNKIGRVLMAHGVDINNQEVELDNLIGTEVRVLVEDFEETDKEGNNTGKVASTISKVKPIAEQQKVN